MDAPRSSTGLQQHYIDACEHHDVKPNSGVLQALHAAEGGDDRGSVSAFVADVDLSSNFLGPKGVLPIVDVVKRIGTIRRVSLKGNGAGLESVLYLSEKLHGLRTLEELDLSDNQRIGPKAGRALKTLVQSCPQLYKLNLDGTIVPQKTKDDIALLLRQNEAARAAARQKEKEDSCETSGVGFASEGGTSVLSVASSATEATTRSPMHRKSLAEPVAPALVKTELQSAVLAGESSMGSASVVKSTPPPRGSLGIVVEASRAHTGRLRLLHLVDALWVGDSAA